MKNQTEPRLVFKRYGMNKDLTQFSTDELLTMHEQCRNEIVKMKANPDIIIMCEQIEKELSARGYR